MAERERLGFAERQAENISGVLRDTAVARVALNARGACLGLYLFFYRYSLSL